MNPTRLHRLQFVAAAFALVAGCAIAWMDARPTWDDAGVTAAAVVIAAGIATLGRLSPWLAAVLVPAPLLAIQLSREVAVLLAIPFALAGAALGAGALRLGSAPPARLPRT